MRSTPFLLSFGLTALSLTNAANADLASTLEVLAYNDVYELKQDNVGGVMVGGPSRVITMAKGMRQAFPNSLVLLAGDTMSPSLWSNQFRGLQMIDAHNAIGLDYASLGNHEFDFGIEGFYNVSQASKFPWLNANCYEIESNKLLRGTVPRAVKTFGNYKVGLLGVMYDMKDASKGLKWTDPIKAANEQARLLRKEDQVDLVIALTHQFYADDNNFANQVMGVDLIYGGHDHNNMMHLENSVPYVKADMNFRTVWRSHIKLNGKHEMTHDLVKVTSDLKSDAEFDGKIKMYEDKINLLYNVVKGSICEPLDLRQQGVRSREMPIGNFFADTTLNAYGPGTADVGTWNGGGIRTDKIYPAGPVSLGTLISWSPFGNTVVVVEVNGANLKKYVANEMRDSCGANGLVKANGFYVNSAGFKYTFRCTGAGQGEVSAMQWFKHPTRQGDIKDDEVLKLALSDFLYTSRYKPVAATKRMVVGENEAMRFDGVIVKFVESLPEKSICYKAEGRNAVVWGSTSTSTATLPLPSVASVSTTPTVAPNNWTNLSAPGVPTAASNST